MIRLIQEEVTNKITTKGIEKMRKLYEVEKELKVDLSNSTPFIVRVRINFHDKIYLEHVKDYYNRRFRGFKRLWIASYSGFFRKHFNISLFDYVDDERTCINVLEAIENGGYMGFKDKRDALKLMEIIDKLVEKEFKKTQKTYLEALDYLKAAK